MEPEGSLPHSQVPATCPYPKPARSSPFPHILLPARFILILSSHLRLGLSLRFPHQNPEYTCPSPHTRYMPRPSHSSRFYHLNNIGWRVQIIKFLIMQFSPLTCYLVLLGPNILLSTLFSNTLSLRSSLNDSDQVSHPYKTIGRIIVLHVLIFKFLDSKLEDKRFCKEW